LRATTPRGMSHDMIKTIFSSLLVLALSSQAQAFMSENERKGFIQYIDEIAGDTIDGSDFRMSQLDFVCSLDEKTCEFTFNVETVAPHGSKFSNKRSIKSYELQQKSHTTLVSKKLLSVELVSLDDEPLFPLKLLYSGQCVLFGIENSKDLLNQEARYTFERYEALTNALFTCFEDINRE
jgi:hypothetical protein